VCIAWQGVSRFGGINGSGLTKPVHVNVNALWRRIGNGFQHGRQFERTLKDPLADSGPLL
jgi:hypothetical protein